MSVPHLNALPAAGSRKLVGVGRFAIGELCSGAVASDALRPHLLSSGGLSLVLDACEALIFGRRVQAAKVQAAKVQAAVALARLGIGTDARETPLPEAIGAPAPLAIPLMGKSQFPGLKFTVRNT